MFTSHSVNSSEPIILDLAVKVSGTACILLNGKFTICIEQLEHPVHITTIYLESHLAEGTGCKPGSQGIFSIC